MEEKGSEVLAYKKAIEGLEKVAEELARYAPMKVNGRCQMYFDGAIHLLKEQEPVKPIDKGDDSYACDKCGEIVGWEEFDVAGIDPVKFKFCPGCGRKVKWGG